MAYRISKSEIKKEITKCGKDPVYFLNNYAKISHPDRGLIPFKTYEFQTELLNSFNDHRFNIILKARQLGISTITAGYIAWLMLFRREKNILVVATKFSTAANLVKKVKALIKNMPEWIKISEISVDNRTAFELTNGSQIKASTTSADAGRSEALSLLVVDEAAHVPELEDMWRALYPTLSTGGRCIALSTPNGVGNWFHQNYIDAEEGRNGFFTTKLPWDVHPERDLEWFEKETKNMSRRDIAQELQCNFNMSGETVIHPEDIEKMLTIVADPKHRTGFDRNYHIWEEYCPGLEYLLVADVARGDGKDYSVFHVIKISTMEVVAEYQGKPNIDMFANLLNSVGREYGDCMLVVENNNIGFSVLEKLIEAEYPNIYHSIKSTHEYVDQLGAEGKNSAVPGFTTSSKTRPLIVAKLEEFIRNGAVTIYSSRTVSELKTFVWNNGKPQAMRSYNDDLVMSLAIACWVRDTVITASKRDARYAKAMLDSMIFANTKLNTTIKGMHGHQSKEMHDKIEREKQIQAEYHWLYKG
tara:strand:+ start:1039 stop:2625 length:1587 start_codon:yes stop_codon:yes gene_type:complete